MPKLTKKTYFSKANRYLTNSRIRDFQKDKHNFFRQHVLGEWLREVTDAMIIGSAVDCWVTESKAAFDKAYRVVGKRTKDAPDYEYQLNNTMYVGIEAMCQSITSQDAYKELAKGKWKKQRILQYDMPVGEHFIGLAGIPDFYTVNGNTAAICDLKTCNNLTPSKYIYVCQDRGYFQQLALYGLLLKLNYPEVEHIEYRHLVMNKDSDQLYPVHTFVFAEEMMLVEEGKLPDIIEYIKNEKDFEPRNIKWSDAYVIGAEYQAREDF